jgi:peptide/nickel transport system substrate-binding protein
MRGSGLARAFGGFVALFVAMAAAQPYVYPDDWSDLPAADARYGGVLVTTTGGDPRTFNPLVSVESNIVVAHMKSPFFGVPTLAWRRPLDGAWEPYGAASLAFSDDGLQIDAVLREGLRWSDGSPITIQDYLLSYELQTHPVAGRHVLDAWFIDGEPIVVEATGERSLRMTFPAPDRIARERLAALWPLPDTVFGETFRRDGPEAVLALWGIESDPDALLFSGMMSLTHFVAGEQLVFERNPYWGDWNVDAAGQPLPYLDGVRFRHAEPDAALNLFLAGEIDELWPQSVDAVGAILAAVAAGDVEASVYEAVFEVPGTTFIAFNLNKASDPFLEALFRDVRFRRAVAHLVDRHAIAELAWQGAAAPLVSSVTGAFGDWVAPDLQAPSFDPEAAQALLAELGFDRRDAAGYLIDGDGRRIRFGIVTHGSSVPRVQAAGILADTMREAGLDVSSTALAFPQLVDQIQVLGDERPFDVVLIGLSAQSRDWPFLMGAVQCDGGFHIQNRSGACVEDVEAQIEALAIEGRRTLDDAAALRIAHEIQRLEVEALHVIQLVVPRVHFAHRQRLAGLLPRELWNVDNGLYVPALTSMR